MQKARSSGVAGSAVTLLAVAISAACSPGVSSEPAVTEPPNDLAPASVAVESLTRASVRPSAHADAGAVRAPSPAIDGGAAATPDAAGARPGESGEQIGRAHV